MKKEMTKRLRIYVRIWTEENTDGQSGNYVLSFWAASKKLLNRYYK